MNQIIGVSIKYGAQIFTLVKGIYQHLINALAERHRELEIYQESEQNLARGCTAWRDAHRKLDERIDAALRLIDSKCEAFCETHDMDKVALLEEIEAVLKGEYHGASVQLSREDQSGTGSGSNGVVNQGEKTNA